MFIEKNKKITPDESACHLAESIDNLTMNVQQGTSLGRNFLIALLRGIGYTLGATLIAGIIATILVKTAKYIPYLENLNLPGVERQSNE